MERQTKTDRRGEAKWKTPKKFEEEEVDVNVALEAIPVTNLFQMDRLKVFI